MAGRRGAGVGGDYGEATTVLHDLGDNATQPHVTRQRRSVISKVLFGMTEYSSDAAGRIGRYALSMQKLLCVPGYLVYAHVGRSTSD